MRLPQEYTLIKEQYIKEIDTTVRIVRHEKSQAHLLLMENEDTNRVFSIAFKTPVENSKGTPHITEHSVLCGSERYPLKDPFVELLKGSVNTFLNAITFNEKTVYPVASTNEKDFDNLMSVYLDAVFSPNVLRDERIFLQEGWHYELADPAGPLTVNGVVYNEMKGAYSDPDSVLDNVTRGVLFSGTPYAYDSGGDPEMIPQLSYEEFLQFYRNAYDPANSFICLYGALDYEEKLRFLDREYLSKGTGERKPLEIRDRAPFTEPKETEACYDAESTEDGAIFSVTKAVGGLTDPVLYLAYEVLGYALLNAPGAPLRDALIKEGIGTEVYGGYDSSCLTPVFSVTVRNADPEDFERFQKTVERVLRKTAEEGVPERTLLAGINNIEFSLREGDYGRIPRGLILTEQVLETWIHDEESSLIHLKYDDTIARLKAAVHSDFYRQLIYEGLLYNPHSVTVRLLPKEGLAAEKEEALKQRLDEKLRSLSEEEKADLIRKTGELKAWQSAAETPEALATIPLLEVADLKKLPLPFTNREETFYGVPLILHPIQTSGILYLDLNFCMDSVETADFPYVTVLKELYTMLDTERFSYRELNDEISLITGGITFTTDGYETEDEPFRPIQEFSVRVKTVYDNIPETVGLLNEIMNRTKYDDPDRIREVLSEIHSGLKTQLSNAGNATALRRVLAASSEGAYEDELFGGLGFFRFLTELLERYDERKEELIKKLRSLKAHIFCPENLRISATAGEDGLSRMKEALPPLLETFPRSIYPRAGRVYDFVLEREGISLATQVQYVAMGGNFLKEGFRYTGHMRVLKTLLGYDYLWNRLRVLGGAYGASSVIRRNGDIGFASYRDPNLEKTLEAYRGIPDYLDALKLKPRDMRKYIIGTISECDTPLSPQARGRRSYDAWRRNVDYEKIRREREEILYCTAEDLKALSPMLRRVLEKNRCAVVGPKEVLVKNRALFERISSLTGENDE